MFKISLVSPKFSFPKIKATLLPKSVSYIFCDSSVVSTAINL